MTNKIESVEILPKVELVEQNDVSKHFRCDYRKMECFLAKAFDDESNKHFLIASTPHIKKFNVSNIQYPFVFDSEIDRDIFFKEFDATLYFDNLLNTIERQINEANEANARLNAKKLKNYRYPKRKFEIKNSGISSIYNSSRELFKKIIKK